MIVKEKDSNPCEHYSTIILIRIEAHVYERAFSGGLIVARFFEWQAEVCLLVDKLKYTLIWIPLKVILRRTT